MLATLKFRTTEPPRVPGVEGLDLARAIYSTVQEGVVIADLRGRIIAANPAFATISEYSEQQLIGRHLMMFRARRHDHTFYQRMRQHLLEHGSWEGEIWSRRRNGEVFPEWLLISRVADSSGKPAFYVCVIVDISRMNHAQSQLQYLAHHDPLTGLANRTLLNLRLRHTVERSHRTGEMCALLFLDLDRFKTINDVLGHEAGDEVLRKAAARMKHRVRENDTIARLGGDEFVLVMEAIHTMSDATLMAEGLIQALRAPFTLASGKEVEIGVSIGISCCPEHGSDAEALLRNADCALYEAKGAGRNTWRFYEPTLVLPVLS